MKQCPVCRTVYTDDSLQFCLADGTKLIFGDDDEEKTISMPAGRSPLRIDIQPNTAPGNSLPAASPQIAEKKGCRPLLIVGVLALMLILLAGIAAAVYFLVPFGRKAEVANNPVNISPNASQPPKSVSNSDDLNGKIANLQKQIEEQKNQKPTPNKSVSPAPSLSVNSPVSGTATARIASTGDGFLALRTEPSVSTGTQLVKIPSGSTVNLSGKCQNPGHTADGKTGRWCLVTYNNQTGWVFDAYLIY